MITIDLDPILIEWGLLTLSWHGICLAAGIIVAYVVLLREGRRQGFEDQTLSAYALWVLPLAAIGARLLVLVEHYSVYVTDPLRLLSLSEGGLTVIGAIAGMFVATVIFARIKDVSGARLLDLLALAILPGIIVGRLGCLILGDVWGVSTNGAWGLRYLHESSAIPPGLLGVPTFPVPIALQLFSAGLVVLLCCLRRRPHGDGLLFAVFLTFYALGRLLIGVLQAGDEIWLGLKAIQLWAIGLLLVATGLWAKLLAFARSLQHTNRSFIV
jgi:phosphatidylglycerol:prolipoprotein diacylglycerol transferase